MVQSSLLHRRLVLAACLIATLAVLGAAGGCGAPEPASKSQTGRGTSEAWWPIEPAARPLNLLLITLDTTRRDRLSCYGFGLGTTPNLDRFAQEGVLFENAVTPVPVTLPAHSSIMTGYYPYQHGVRNNGSFVLSDSAVTLAELLKAKGYDTGAIVGAFPVAARFGLSQGFDSYDDQFPAVSREREEETSRRRGTEVTSLALRWLGSHTAKPFFLWAHYYDAHAPYKPVEPFRGRFPRDPYVAQIAAMDAAVGELLAGLKEKGLQDNTVVMIMGDHGEGLGDHVELTHTVFLYRPTMDIPFLVRFPDAAPFSETQWRGVKIAGLVDLIDALPTAWNALGLPRTDLPGGPGMSLLPVVRGKGATHPEVYLESLIPRLENWATDLRGLETPGWKYIRVPRAELYNLEKDPGERDNLAGKEKGRVAEMESRLAAMLEGEKARKTKAMDPETAERLRSLGYLSGSSGGGGDAGPTADPKDMIWVPMSVKRAQDLADAHRLPAALAVVDSVLAKHPKTNLARQLRALFLTQVGRAQEGLKAYEQALAECGDCPDRLKLLQGQISALLAAGQAPAALKQARDLVQVSPKQPWLHFLLGQALLANNDVQGARTALQDEIRILPHDPAPLFMLSNLEKSQKRYAEAERGYRQVLGLRSEDGDALVMLSELLDETGRPAEATQMLSRALAAEPAHPGANYLEAEVLRKAGKNEEAVNHLLKALESLPNDVQILHRLGGIYIDLKEFAPAAECLEKAVATGKAYQAVYATLGVAYSREGNQKKAIDTWERAIRLQPDSPMVVRLRQDIERARQSLAE